MHIVMIVERIQEIFHFLARGRADRIVGRLAERERADPHHAQRLHEQERAEPEHRGAIDEREQVPAEPSRADQDATFTSLSWMIGASLA